MIEKCVASLRIYSEAASLDEISSSLKRASTGGYDAGDLVSSRSASGKRREGAMWMLTSEASGDECLLESLTVLVDFLEAEKDRIKGVEQAQVDVTLGLFSDNSQLNCILPALVMRTLSTMNIDLLVSGYVSSE